MDYEQAAFLLAGVVLSGAAMLMRGDFLGRKAASEVESRLTARIDREMEFITSELGAIKATLIRIEERERQ